MLNCRRPTPLPRLFHLLLALVLTLPAGAKLEPAALRLPEALAQAERLPVRGRQGWKLLEQLTFGPCRVYGVERSPSKGSDLFASVPGLGYEGSKRRQTFAFKLAGDGAVVWSGAAATNLHRRALDVGVDVELRNQSGFTALLATDTAPNQVWTLALAEKGERPLTGTLSLGSQSVAVKGTNQLAGTPLPLGETSGYVFEAGGKPVAAVEVINDGAVWFSADLDPALRGPVAAAIASLLLFETLRPSLAE